MKKGKIYETDYFKSNITRKEEKKFPVKQMLLILNHYIFCFLCAFFLSFSFFLFAKTKMDKIDYFKNKMYTKRNSIFFPQ